MLSIATNGCLFTLRAQVQRHHGASKSQRNTWLQIKAEQDRRLSDTLLREDEEIVVIIRAIMGYI